jgi:hypothetical protein
MRRLLKTLTEKICAPASLCYDSSVVGGQFFDIAAFGFVDSLLARLCRVRFVSAAKT